MLTVRRNTGGDYGILTIAVGPTGTVTLSGLTISNGKATQVGGGIHIFTGALNLINCSIAGNTAGIAGGGVYASSATLNVSGSTISGNAVTDFLGHGGGIYADSSFTIANSTISGNTAQSGAALYALAFPNIMTIHDSIFSNNVAIPAGGSYGAGIVFESRINTTLGISNTSIRANTADGCAALCIFSSIGDPGTAGSVNVVNSTISGNTDSFAGSSTIDNSGGTLSVTNSTIAGNSGGGISSGYDGNLNVTNTTIAGNAGGKGITAVSATVKSSIIALNAAGAGADVNGTFTSGGFNLIGRTDIGATGFVDGVNNDQVGATATPIDPKLEKDGAGKPLLKNNGGPTQTIALLFGSPAIDKGTSAGLTGALATDQRGAGFPRTFNDPHFANAPGGDGTDIGAFEFGGVRIDIDANGSYDALTDGLLIIRYLFGLTGTSLTNGAIGTGYTRSDPTEILQFLNSIRPVLDVDNNSQVDALTDGLMLIRYLFGIRGTALTTGALAPGVTWTPAQIEAYILSLMPQ